jgi:hypothetical protein
MLDEILKILAGIFGGGLFTALVFVFTFSNKITSIETRQKSMKETLDKHVETPVSVCPMHLQTVTDVNTLLTNQQSGIKKVGIIEQKVDILEQDVAVLKSRSG